ncbi:PAS domain-containing protein, partial [Oscillatoriales cyanobacterium LEGE 11467]
METKFVRASLTALFERLTLRISRNLVGSVFINTIVIFIAILLENPRSIEANVALGWQSSLTGVGHISALAAISSILVSLVARQTLTPREIRSKAKKRQCPCRQAEDPPPIVEGESQSIAARGTEETSELSVLPFDRLLLDTIRAIESAPDLQSALEITLVQICQSVGWDYGEIWVPSGDGQALQNHPAHYIRPDRPIAVRNAIEEFRAFSEGLTFLPSEGLPGQVWTTLQSEWIENLAAEPGRVYLREPLARECGFKAVLGIPLFENRSDRESTVLAIALLFVIKPHPNQRQVVRFWSAASSQLGAIVAQKSLYAEFQAYLAATTDVMLAIDAQGYCLKIAPTLTDPAYRAAHGEVGRSLHDIFDSEQARTFIGYIWKALSTKEPVQIEYRLTIPSEHPVPRNEGENEVWFSATISPLCEDAVIWIARDIT